MPRSTLPVTKITERAAGVVSRRVKFDTTGIAAGVVLGIIPAGSRIHKPVVTPIVALGGGTTPAVTVGTTATGTELSGVNAGVGVYAENDTTVYVSLTGTPTSGDVVVDVPFVAFNPS